MDDELQNISQHDKTVGTTLAGVIWLLMKDPQFIAMAEHNDRERFIDGCLADPSFQRKVTLALQKVREAAIAA